MWAWVITTSLTSRDLVAGLVERALEVAPSSRGRACRCRRARSRRRPAAPTRCSAGRRAGRAAAAAARLPGSTRSPRPPSRGRVGLRPARAGTLPSRRWRRRAAAARDPRAGERVPRRARLGARPARRADARHPRAVRRGRGREHPLAGGRVAARGRVPVRAPGRALGDRRHRADHAPEGAARALPLRLRRGAALDPRRCCASTSPSTSRTWRHRERRRLRAVADRLLPRGAARPAGRDRVLDDARRAAAARAAARGARARGVAAAATSRCPGRTRASGARSRDAQLDGFPSAELAEAREIDASLRIQADRQRERAGRRRPGAAGPRRARAQAPLREVRADERRWAITLWPTPAAAQQAGMGTRELEAFVERALFLDRDDPVAAWGELRAFQAGLIERLAPAREIRIEAPGHRPDASTSRAARGSTPTASATCRRARSSPARTRRPPRA